MYINFLRGIIGQAEIFANNKIGVMLSGGPDSAILYYLIQKENQEDDSPFEIIPMCCPKVDGANHYAEKINELVCEELSLPKPEILYVGNPWQAHDAIVTNAIVNTLHYDIVARIFVADNITPPVKFSGLEPVRVQSTFKEVIQPFFHLTKDKILELFYIFNQEVLLTQTHTCTEQPRGRCQRCWQCQERDWGFKQLGRDDPGSE